MSVFRPLAARTQVIARLDTKAYGCISQSGTRETGSKKAIGGTMAEPKQIHVMTIVVHDNIYRGSGDQWNVG